MAKENLKYTKQHEWARVEGETAVVGITDHAQSQLGDITFVELPEVGKEVKQGEEFAVVESIKAASDVYAPVSGEVQEVNSELDGSPEIINQSPYEGGWICRIRMTDESELDNLMDSAAYDQFLQQESHE